MPTRVVALDADFINALYYASRNGFPDALNAIVGEGRLIALTSTVVREVAWDPANYPKDAAVRVWIDNQKLLGNLKVYDTSGFAPGEDRGEQSILSALPRMYADGAGGGVQVFTNDAAARSLFAGSTVADAYDTQGGILFSWLEGALSVKEYYDLFYGLCDTRIERIAFTTSCRSAVRGRPSALGRRMKGSISPPPGPSRRLRSAAPCADTRGGRFQSKTSSVPSGLAIGQNHNLLKSLNSSQVGL